MYTCSLTIFFIEIDQLLMACVATVFSRKRQICFGVSNRGGGNGAFF